MASGALPVSAAVRSWFWAAGPPTSASGTCGAELAAEPADHVGGGRGRRPRSPDDADDGASVGGGLGDDAGVDHVGVGAGQLDDLRASPAGTVTKSGAAAPGPNDGDDHVVAVAARAALVDDARRRACPGACRGPARPAGAAGRARRPACGPVGAGPAPVQRAQRPSAARSGSRVLASTSTRSPRATSTAGSRVSAARATAIDREDHAEGHRTEHHDRHHEHRGQRQHDGERRQEHCLAGGATACWRWRRAASWPSSRSSR